MRKLQKPSREVGDIAAPVQLAHFAIDHLKQNNLQFEVGPVKRLLPRVLCFALCFFSFFFCQVLEVSHKKKGVGPAFCCESLKVSETKNSFVYCCIVAQPLSIPLPCSICTIHM